MKTNRNLLAVAAGLVACLVVVWFSTSIQGVEKTYEVQPQITIPEYRTDAARAIDAYERLMERYMDLTERNLIGIRMDLKRAVEKLDSIDDKLIKLSTRMAQIEKALGIGQSMMPARKKSTFKEAEKTTQKQSSPPVAE